MTSVQAQSGSAELCIAPHGQGCRCDSEEGERTVRGVVRLGRDVSLVEYRSLGVVVSRPGAHEPAKVNGRLVRGVRVLRGAEELSVGTDRWRVYRVFSGNPLMDRTCPLCGSAFRAEEPALVCDRCCVGIHKNCADALSPASALACPTLGCTGEWQPVLVGRSQETRSQ